jgi:acetyltransferase-like isoleucine patch superfamily enzyme
MDTVDRFLVWAIALVSSAPGHLYLRLRGVQYGSAVRLYGLPIVSRSRESSIVLGKRVVLCSSSIATALGVNHPVVLRTLAPGARIIIGDDVGVSGGSICAARQIEIGGGVLIGANSTIADTDFHHLSSVDRRYGGLPAPATAEPVEIGDGAFIGANVTILKGVRIGKNSVIGAASVVTQDVPANVVAAGNPCRVLERLDGQ